MSETSSTRLRKAMRERQLVRFRSRFQGHESHGYVQAVGTRFFLLALVSDRIRLDGYECFRIDDIRALRQDPYAAFMEAALKKRGEKLGRAPHIDVSDIGKLLRSAAKAFPLVTIHIEMIAPEVCYIGRVGDVGGWSFSLRAIRPDGSWESDYTPYRLSSITRVDFGADYEDALYLVGGEPESHRQ